LAAPAQLRTQKAWDKPSNSSENEGIDGEGGIGSAFDVPSTVFEVSHKRKKRVRFNRSMIRVGLCALLIAEFWTRIMNFQWSIIFWKPRCSFWRSLGTVINGGCGDSILLVFPYLHLIMALKVNALTPSGAGAYTMKLGKALIASAVTGMVLGTLAGGCGGENAAAPGVSDPTSAAKACCAGKNECKAKGGCKTADHECATKNDCKGKGGKPANCKLARRSIKRVGITLSAPSPFLFFESPNFNHGNVVPQL
jgi:hypothetical protein